MKRLTISAMLGLLLLSACGSGGSGASSPPAPQYLPAGNYSVVTLAGGNNLPNFIVCSITLDPFIAIFGQATAISNGTGQVTINQNFQQTPFNLNIAVSPCGSWTTDGITYTMTNCSYNSSNEVMAANMNASNFSASISKLGCNLITNFKLLKN